LPTPPALSHPESSRKQKQPTENNRRQQQKKQPSESIAVRKQKTTESNSIVEGVARFYLKILAFSKRKTPIFVYSHRQIGEFCQKIGKRV